MVVALVGHRDLEWGPTQPLAWPAGTQAGHVAVVWSDWPEDGPRQSGWRYARYATWWRILSAADVAAGPGEWAGRLRGLAVVSGCRGIGGTSMQRGVWVREAGGAALVQGWTGYWAGAIGLDPATDRLGEEVLGARSQWLAWWLLTGAGTGYREVPRDGDAVGYRSFELLPNKGPDAPTLVGPSGQVDATQPVALSLVHNSSSGSTQEAVRWRAKPASSGTWQYITAAGTLAGTEQTIATSASTITLPAGTLTSVQWDWSASTMDNGAWSPWASSAQVLPSAPPSAVVTLTTVAESLSVTVGWTPTTPGGSQTAWQVAVAPAGGGVGAALYTSPVTAGAGTQTVVAPQAWANGGSYQGWVRVQQTGGLWSQWTASSAQTVSWTPPTAPGGITAADGSPPSVTVQGIPAGGDRLDVEHYHDGAWQPLAHIDLPNATGVVAVPLAPYGVSRLYRARVQRTVSGVLLPSAWVESAPLTSTDRCAYLVDPDDAADYLPITLSGDPVRNLVQGVGVYYGLSAARARTDRTPTAGEAGTATVDTDTPAERAALVAWLSTRPSWVMRWPAEPEGLGWVDTPPMRMALANPVQWARISEVANPGRAVSFDWVEA